MIPVVAAVVEDASRLQVRGNRQNRQRCPGRFDRLVDSVEIENVGDGRKNKSETGEKAG